MKPSHEQLRQRLQAAVGDRFRVLEPLSASPFAVVFRATDATSKGDVALTTFAPAALGATGVVERLARAVDRAAGLAHPGILAPFALEQSEDVVFYPMPVARGDTVENRFRAGTPVPLHRVVDLARGVAAALDYAHGQGVVHGALKPSNIVLTDQGAACVSDFGIAQAIWGDGGAYSAESQVDQAYLAPEQWRHRPVDGRTDQHALAIITYELLTGKRRVDSPDVAGIHTIEPVDVPPNLPLQHGIGLHVNAALQRALSANPRNRFPTVSAFANALAGDDARPTSTVATTGPPRRLSRRGLGVPIALASLGAVLLLTLGGQHGRERVQQEWRALSSGLVSPQVSVPIPALLPGIASVRVSSPTTVATSSKSSLLTRLADFLGSGSAGRSSTVPVPTTTTSTTKRSLLTRLADFLGRGSGGRSSTVPVPTTTKSTTPSAPIRSASSRSANGPDSASSEACLTVSADSGTAVVIIDGWPRGTTPYATCLGEGHHIVSARSVSASYEPRQVAVSIAKGDTASAVFHRTTATPMP